MPVNQGPHSVAITGATGFIGSHLYRSLLRTRPSSDYVGIDIREFPGAPGPLVIADIRDRSAISRAIPRETQTVYHLAALAEVVMPFEELSALFSTNIGGTIEVLNASGNGRVIFASSSAVYGTTSGSIATEWNNVRPEGVYGASKAAAEMAGKEWAHERGGTFLAFRFGNVIGQGCRGLIPYLVQHAVNHPQGQPAQLRGGGRLLRDYVPVQHVVRIMEAAAQAEFASGVSAAYNIGTARSLSNREVAEQVRGLLAKRGFVLEINYENPPAPGEALSVTLDVTRTEETFGIKAPDEGEVHAAIDSAASYWLEKALEGSKKQSVGG